MTSTYGFRSLHAVENDGITPQLFALLAKDRKGGDMMTAPVCIPPTLVFERGFVKAMFTTEISRMDGDRLVPLDADELPKCFLNMHTAAAAGYRLEVKKKNGRDVYVQEVYEDFTMGAKPKDIVAVLMVCQYKDRDDYSEFKYLDSDALHVFLMETVNRPRAMLQKFIPPKGQNNTLIFAAWSPLVLCAEGRRSVHALSEQNLSANDRAVTFETDDVRLVTDLALPKTVIEEITTTCAAIRTHIEGVERGFTMTRLACYFKIDCHSTLHMIASTSVRLQRIKDTKIRAPLDLNCGAASPQRNRQEQWSQDLLALEECEAKQKSLRSQMSKGIPTCSFGSLLTEGRSIAVGSPSSSSSSFHDEDDEGEDGFSGGGGGSSGKKNNKNNNKEPDWKIASKAQRISTGSNMRSGIVLPGGELFPEKKHELSSSGKSWQRHRNYMNSSPPLPSPTSSSSSSSASPNSHQKQQHHHQQHQDQGIFSASHKKRRKNKPLTIEELLVGMTEEKEGFSAHAAAAAAAASRKNAANIKKQQRSPSASSSNSKEEEEKSVSIKQLATESKKLSSSSSRTSSAKSSSSSSKPPLATTPQPQRTKSKRVQEEHHPATTTTATTTSSSSPPPPTIIASATPTPQKKQPRASSGAPSWQKLQQQRHHQASLNVGSSVETGLVLDTFSSVPRGPAAQPFSSVFTKRLQQEDRVTHSWQSFLQKQRKELASIVSASPVLSGQATSYEQLVKGGNDNNNPNNNNNNNNLGNMFDLGSSNQLYAQLANETAQHQRNRKQQQQNNSTNPYPTGETSIDFDNVTKRSQAQKQTHLFGSSSSPAGGGGGGSSASSMTPSAMLNMMNRGGPAGGGGGSNNNNNNNNNVVDESLYSRSLRQAQMAYMSPQRTAAIALNKTRASSSSIFRSSHQQHQQPKVHFSSSATNSQEQTPANQTPSQKPQTQPEGEEQERTSQQNETATPTSSSTTSHPNQQQEEEEEEKEGDQGEFPEAPKPSRSLVGGANQFRHQEQNRVSEHLSSNNTSSSASNNNNNNNYKTAAATIPSGVDPSEVPQLIDPSLLPAMPDLKGSSSSGGGSSSTSSSSSLATESVHLPASVPKQLDVVMPATFGTQASEKTVPSSSSSSSSGNNPADSKVNSGSKTRAQLLEIENEKRKQLQEQREIRNEFENMTIHEASQKFWFLRSAHPEVPREEMNKLRQHVGQPQNRAVQSALALAKSLVHNMRKQCRNVLSYAAAQNQQQQQQQQQQEEEQQQGPAGGVYFEIPRELLRSTITLEDFAALFKPMKCIITSRAEAINTIFPSSSSSSSSSSAQQQEQEEWNELSQKRFALLMNYASNNNENDLDENLIKKLYDFPALNPATDQFFSQSNCALVIVTPESGGGNGPALLDVLSEDNEAADTACGLEYLLNTDTGSVCYACLKSLPCGKEFFLTSAEESAEAERKAQIQQQQQQQQSKRKSIVAFK